MKSQKIMHNTERMRNLMQYSASAVVMLSSVKLVNAQAIYTDIDPDTIIDNELYTYRIDMDNDGHTDFQFFNLSYFFSTTPSNPSDEFRHRIIVGVDSWIDTAFNGIIGVPEQFWSPIAETYTWYLPSAFNAGFFVSEGLLFDGFVVQVMAWRDWGGAEIIDGDTILGVPNQHIGEWRLLDEDRYLGVKFRAGDGFIHYGWIRCYVHDLWEGGFEITIKDYAYESKPGAPIFTGDQEGGLMAPEDTTGTVAIPDPENGDFQLYAYNNMLYGRQPEGRCSALNLYDMQGKCLLTQNIGAAHFKLKLQQPSGLYLAQLQTPVGLRNCKIVIK